MAEQRPFQDTDALHRTSCPVCHGTIRHDLVKSAMSFDTCIGCGLVFMNPMPTQQWYDRRYDEQFWSDKQDRQSSPRSHLRKRFEKEHLRGQAFVTALRATGVANLAAPTILEVGCGYGAVVTTLTDAFGGTGYGIEPGQEAQRCARALGVTILGNLTHDADWDGQRFDVIVLSHVLEHVVDPRTLINQLAEHLNDDGILLIEVPNASASRSISLYHPYGFTTLALTTLLASCGLAAHTLTHGGRKGRLRRTYLLALARRSSAPAVKGRVRGVRITRAWAALWNRGLFRRIDRSLARRHRRIDHAAMDRWLDAAAGPDEQRAAG